MTGNFFLGADSPNKFEIREMQLGKPSEGQVLIQVKACGVCGTDVHIYHGEAGSAEVTPPVVLGHEFSGIVTEVGAGVTALQPGDHVAIDPNIYCGKCRPCRMGKKQNCEHLYALGVNTNGGFAEYVLCPASQCFKVKPEVPFDVAAMAEPLACVIHGIDQVGINAGQNVLVVGGGTIGLLMVQMAKLSGAATVILSEPVAKRRDIALQVGADAVIDPIHEDLGRRIQEIIGASGADVVIECVGKPMAAKQAIQTAGLGASVLLFSVPGVEDQLLLPLFDIYKKELRIVGSMINPNTQQRAVDLINSGRLQIIPLITHAFDHKHLEDAIKMQMSDKSIKVMVHPESGND